MERKKLNKKILIIGSGLSGLSAGIYAQLAGFDSEIYEKHIIPGGLCTIWKRQGYKIDNCVHWLTGRHKYNQVYKVWKDTGVLGDNIPLVNQELFYSSEVDEKKLTLWRDLKRTKKEMLAIAPEDAKEIKKFIRYVKKSERFQMPAKKPFTMFGLQDIPWLIPCLWPIIVTNLEYGTEDLESIKKRFKNETIKKLLTDFLPPKYSMQNFIAAYSTITSGNGDFPVGGSEKIIDLMVERYKALGGTIHLNKEVEKINIVNGHAESVLLTDGNTITADYYVSAADTDVTFGTLLDKSYMHPKLKQRYDEAEKNPTISGFHVAIGVDGHFDTNIGMHYYQCDPIKIGTRTVTRMNTKTYYEYGDDFSPEGKSILQVNIYQQKEDYEFWQALAEKDDNKQAYKAEKQRIAQEILNSLNKQYPEYEGKFSILDVWTPATYKRFTGAFNGAYMSFVKTVGTKNVYVPNDIEGLDNVFVASQWLMSPGGLPCAVGEGKNAIHYVLKKETGKIKIKHLTDKEIKSL